MTSTTWTQTAGMDSGTSADAVVGYADSALAAAAAAATSETNAATSAANAAASETNAGNSATASASSAAASAASATAASASETAAAASETAAATSETNAATSETNAAASAATATTNASEASASATAAASSASAASTSETNAASSASAASTSETNAATSETNAASSASAASTSETNAAASETAAAASETAAAASETAAAASETAAATSETNAAASASSAATSASSAASSASSASASADAALAALDSFDDRYLGSKSSAPTLDNDGNALLTGALYFSSTTSTMFVWTGSAWLSTQYVSNNVDINGGTIDGTVIGGSTPAAISGTALTATTSATLQHSASTKLATTATGIDVTGTVTADGLTVDATTSVLQKTSGNPTLQLNAYPSAQNAVVEIQGVREDFSGSSANMYLKTNDGTSTLNRMRISYNGDISFYEDTGTTPKFFWDASAESLTLSNATTGYTLDLDNSGTGEQKYLSLSSGATVIGDINRPNGTNDIELNANFGGIAFGTGTAGTASERMRITSAGNVGIGTVSPAAPLHVKVATNANFTAQNTAGIVQLQAINDAANAFTQLDLAGNPITFSANGTERLRITSTGSVGIGTSSPGEALDVVGSARVLRNTGATNTGDQNSIVAGAITSGSYNSSYGAGLQFQITNSGGGYSGSRIVSRLNADNNTANLVFQARNYGFSDSMTIDADGNVIMGKTTADNTTAGFTYYGAAYGVSIVKASGAPLILNRLTSDGDIAVFRKSGTTVGSIGSVAGTNLVIGSGATGLRFFSSGSAIQPRNTNGDANNDTIDLGLSTNRFKDLYLSGGVYLGGTGAANKLDDYETGTWTPTLIGVTGITYLERVGTYTKVGNLVHCSFQIRATYTASGNSSIGGLPFTSGNNANNYGTGGYFTLHDAEAGITPSLYVQPNQSVAGLWELNNGTNWALPSGTGRYLNGSILYRTT